jgi:hypothetical protein
MAELPNLWDAIGAVIDSGANPPNRANGVDPIFDPRFPRFYRGRTRETLVDGQWLSPPPGYVLLGLEILPDADGYNGESGRDATVRLHAWARDPDDARRLGRWLVGLLHHVPLTVPGFDPVVGTLSVSGPTSDQPGEAWQMEGTYAAEAMETA